MKVKGGKLFIGSLIAFVLIGTFNSCQKYKIRKQHEEERHSQNIQQAIEQIKSEGIFTPVETTYETNNQPTTEKILTKNDKNK